MTERRKDSNSKESTFKSICSSAMDLTLNQLKIVEATANAFKVLNEIEAQKSK